MLEVLPEISGLMSIGSVRRSEREDCAKKMTGRPKEWSRVKYVLVGQTVKVAFRGKKKGRLLNSCTHY